MDSNYVYELGWLSILKIYIGDIRYIKSAGKSTGNRAHMGERVSR